MARKDPTLFALHAEFQDPVRTTDFLREFDLLPSTDPIGLNRNGNNYLALCRSKPFNPRKPFCPVCRNEKSAHHGSSVYNPAAGPTGLPVFNTLNIAGRPNRKIDPKDVVYVAFCLAYEIRVVILPCMIGRKLGSETVVYWSQKIRECALAESTHAPKMGGVGDIVEVDECYMRGRRKANRGRLMQGNRLGHQGHRANNYFRRTQGPWLFGMMVRRTREVRAFWVQDRSAATLIQLIKNNVAPGTVIYSDEWRAYRQVVRHGFHHEAVNHSKNFVVPVSGCSTQIIERQWREIKKPLVRLGPGVRERTLPFHLALFWWLSKHGKDVCSDPFLRLLELISKHH